MPIAIRHRADAASSLRPLPDMFVHREDRALVMSALQRRPLEDMAQRFADGHRAYVAWHAGEPAAWGWVATRTATIGELGSTFAIPEGDQYLWNFVTLPAHRGMGVYPRLLDAIVAAERESAERHWVAFAPENHASGAGIMKAGFREVAELSFDVHGRPATSDIVPGGARTAARLLGLPAAAEKLASCWRCVRNARTSPSSCHAGPCACDYQQPASGCAA